MKNNKSTKENKNQTTKTTYATQLFVEEFLADDNALAEHNTPVPRTPTKVSKNSSQKENGMKNFQLILPWEETENPIASDSTQADPNGLNGTNDKWHRGLEENLPK